jgi:protein O-mannosyl-transferase
MPARTHVLALAALAAVAGLAYANSLRAGFTLDNYYLVLADERVHRATLDAVAQIFSQDYWAPRFVTGVYRPLATLSLLFNYAVLGGRDSPLGYHVLNLLLHWGNTALVYGLALAVFADAWAAFFTAAIFTAHPIATEAVTNIVGRADLLATMAVLGGTLLHLRSTRTTGSARAACLVALALAAALGLLSKESAVGVLGAMLAWDLASWADAGERGRWPLGRRVAGYVALVPAFAGVALLRAAIYRTLDVRDTPFLENPLVRADWWAARLTALKVLGRYLWLLVWPRTLSCDYSYDAIPVVAWPPRGWEDWQGPLALAGLLAGIGALVWWRRRSRPLVFFELFFLLTLLPVSNLVLTIGTIMGERLLYLPSIGFAGTVVLAISALCRRLAPATAGERRPGPNGAARVVLGLVVLAYAARTHARNADWQDDLRLWQSTVRAVPGSYKAHKALASTLAAADAGHARLDVIIDEEERALAIIDTSGLGPEARSMELAQSLGDHYRLRAARLGPQGEAGRAALRRAVEMLEQAATIADAKDRLKRARALRRGPPPAAAPDAVPPGIHVALGDAYLTLGDVDRAADAFRHLSALDPESRVGLGRVQMATGDLGRAAISFIEALTLDRDRADAWNLLLAAYERADPAGCALVRDPANAASARPDWNCPLVHAHVCTADAELVRLFLAAGQPAAAQAIAEHAVGKQGCPRESIVPPAPGG